jgi:hypothetical protein
MSLNVADFSSPKGLDMPQAVESASAPLLKG